MKKIKTIISSGRLTKKDPYDTILVALLSVAEKLMASKVSTSALPRMDLQEVSVTTKIRSD